MDSTKKEEGKTRNDLGILFLGVILGFVVSISASGLYELLTKSNIENESRVITVTVIAGAFSYFLAAFITYLFEKGKEIENKTEIQIIFLLFKEKGIRWFVRPFIPVLLVLSAVIIFVILIRQISV